MKRFSLHDDDMPAEDEVVSMYEKVLDHLLTPAQVKEQLMQSQSTDKKWKTILMHKKLFEGEHAAKSGETNLSIQDDLDNHNSVYIQC